MVTALALPEKLAALSSTLVHQDVKYNYQTEALSVVLPALLFRYQPHFQTALSSAILCLINTRRLLLLYSTKRALFNTLLGLGVVQQTMQPMGYSIFRIADG